MSELPTLARLSTKAQYFVTEHSGSKVMEVNGRWPSRPTTAQSLTVEVKSFTRNSVN